MKMLHVTIQTNRFDEELCFYQDIVGLKMITDMRPMGKTMVFLADENGDTEVEIISNPDADDAGNMYLSIGFKTENVDEKRKELEEKGMEVTPMVCPAPNVEFFFVKDPAGVSVQFM